MKLAPILFFRYMDLVSLMSYDLHGSWEDVTGHNSPLFPNSNETGEQRYLNMVRKKRTRSSHRKSGNRLIIIIIIIPVITSKPGHKVIHFFHAQLS